MESKTLSLLSLSILALVMFMSLASATLTLTEISVLPSPANHNTQVTAAFDLTADQDYTTLDWSNSVDPSKGSWTTLPTTTSINNGQTLTLTAVFTINEHASGTITDAQIVVEDTGTSDTDSLIFSSLTINDSPSLSIELIKDLTKTQNGKIKITNTGNVDLTNLGLEVVSGSPDFSVNFGSISSPLTSGNFQEIEVSSTDVQNLELGDDNIITIRATSTEADSSEITLEVPVSFCSCENPGDLSIKIKDISNKGINGDKKFGDDEEWFAFEEIEVEIEIENKGNDDIDDVSVEWGLYNKDTKEWTIEVDEEDEFNLKDGDEETITITFKIDDNMDEDLEDLNNGDLVLYVRATGEVDNDENPETCASDSEEIEMIVESDFVILTDIEFLETVQCDSEVQITADVWNIGDDDQDEVMVFIYNKELGIDEKIEIGDIDAFDSEKLNIIIKIPEDAEEKWYSLIFSVYDEDNDIYENDYDDEESKFVVPLKVEGNCGLDKSNAVVSASLESGGKAGQELIIKAVVTNTGDELAVYDLNVEGYANWALLAGVEPGTVVLGAGESKEVLITLNVDKDASGEKSFDIVVKTDSQEIVNQPVSVSIEKADPGFAGITGSVISEGNWYLWAIGALNIILVIIIIIVAVRVARK